MEAKVGLDVSDIRRQEQHPVRREVLHLDAEVVEEVAEEVARLKAKPSCLMQGEDHPLIRLRRGHDLARRRHEAGHQVRWRKGAAFPELGDLLFGDGEPLHVTRGPVGSAIDAGCGGGKRRSSFATAPPERRSVLSRMKESRAWKNAMVEVEKIGTGLEATEVKGGKSSSVPFDAYLNGQS
ncbi:Hypothetical predicted protein [Olea europaea subsp. europaea]|uniref:Uncharacterized protein n=1 Tax=Olea europaea subsp. europaea TaxID=158383 RepID=A0A8S0TIU2_OLEEU|nr:Hypothetical predicted protein [Olea europaea subsp. europaea]